MPVWSITCFYIDRMYRGTGVAGALLAAAVEHARDAGARLIEGYPIDPGDGRVTNASAYTGVLDMFRAAGFDEITRRGGRPDSPPRARTCPAFAHRSAVDCE